MTNKGIQSKALHAHLNPDRTTPQEKRGNLEGKSKQFFFFAGVYMTDGEQNPG